MTKKTKAVVKIQISAGKATPAPPVGPSLAQHGLNIGEFCQKFNEQSKELEGFTIPVEVTIFEDRTYTFKMKQPPASELIKKIAGIEKGAKNPKKDKIAQITSEQLKKIAEKKLSDLNTKNINQAMKIIKGTALNMGVEIINKPDK